jgi:hypothetical protein
MICGVQMPGVYRLADAVLRDLKRIHSHIWERALSAK